MIGFQSPLLLIAIAAAVLPVLIYLFTRDRVAVVPFSTLRFFAGSSVKLVRRKRWLETLLLALRALLIALIAIAFARPFFKKAADTTDGTQRLSDAVVLLVDVSQSMGRPGVWKQAMQKADAAIGSSTVSVIAFDQSPQVLATWADASAVRSKLESLQPQPTGTDLSAALRKADELLADVAADRKRVVLVSDLQRSGWSDAQAAFKLKPGVTLQIESVTPEAAGGIAIVEANLPQSVVNDHAPLPIAVRVSNIGTESAKDVTVELALPDQPVQTQKLTIPANQRLTASFRAKADKPGDHPGTITLKTDTGNTAGTIYLNPHVLPRIGITILTADEDTKRPGSAPFFLAKAIRPADDSPFDVTVVGSSSNVDLKDASVLIVADVGAISPSLQKAITDFHQRGGGILLMPGPRTQPATFTTNFGAFAPCQLRKVIQASDTRKGGAKALITRVELEHPILEVFQRPHSGNFSAVAIDKYWEVADSQLSRVPLRLDDGRPFMLEKSDKGVGTCILIASQPDPTWNNFPQRAIYLPLIHQTLRYLAVRGETPTSYQVGEVLPIPAGHTIRDPAGQSQSGSSTIATTAGHYMITDNAGKTVMTYAVNVPFAEANVTPMAADELRASVESAEAVPTAASGNLVVGKSGREFWTYIIGLSLVLLVLELFVSNRVPRH